VQHRFKERASDMAELAKRGAHFYVCGSTSMGGAIKKEVAAVVGGDAALDKLQRDGRYYEELW